MSLLNEAVRIQAQQILNNLEHPVKLLVFTQEMECQFCRENRQLAEEIAGLSDKITLSVHDFQQDKEAVEKYRIERVPALVVEGEKDYGIRFYGIPAGYEFTTLLNALQLAGRRNSGLKPQTREKLQTITSPVKIDVFVTLTCPYCPMMAGLAHRFAMENENITASAIDAQEFPVLANYYQVSAVPKTVINGLHHLEGALPEDRFLAELLKFAGGPQ
ncbi:MAG: thioredoxin family protein [candidate division WOR-3 bacterium]|uniref:Glutaredoxin n=1 Tax=candidate division WOR-3 bacterium TaxID=2052148 RepID=A0A7C1NFM2_UNCW3|nr:thioredoxin family protein [candidate division WOR-3 bacterium]